MINVNAGKITVNDKDSFIFGGELHYFRVPKQDWRDRIRQIKAAGANMISTYVPWIFHEAEEGAIDLTGETRPEKDFHTFLQIVKEEGMYCLVRPGPYVMAEIIDHGVPTWFIEKYPEALAQTSEGEMHPTRVVSYMHPLFLEKVEKWYEAVCAVIAPYQAGNGGPVILFQLDNEVGMFHWVINQPDYNESTLAQFEGYIRSKYSDEQFELEFNRPSSNIHELTHSIVKKPEENDAFSLRNEFSLFLRQHYRRFIEYLKESVEQKGITIPFVVNIHGFHTIDIVKRGTMYPIGISQLLEAAKIENVLMAGDYYIGNIEYDNFIDIVLANSFTKAIQWKEQPLFSAEFQGGCSHDKPRLQPSAFDLTTRLCVADGMNGINYYMFSGGENYENIGLLGRRHEWQAPLSSKGEMRPHYRVISHLGNMFNVFNSPLLETKPEVDTHLGFYPDYYMTEFHDDHTKSMIDQIQHGREAFLYNGMAKALRTNNIIFDSVNLLDEQQIDPGKVPTLWIFASEWMDEPVQRKLAQYLQNGGHLILFPTIPTKTLRNKPCTILRDFIDVRIKGTEHHGFVNVAGIDSVSAAFIETYEVREGAFGWIEHEEKEAAAFQKKIGKGMLTMFGIGMEIDFYHKNSVVKRLAEKAGVHSRFRLQDEVDISVRKSDEGTQFFFLQNFDEYEKETVIEYKNQLLFGGKKIVVPPRSGLMLPYQVELHDDLKLVFGTGEIFGSANTEHELKFDVRMVQQQEEFKFISKTWEPMSNGMVEVSKASNQEFIVRMRKSNPTATIHFQLQQR
ncbi:beta-galactosidase [Falsibacillus albus]|uniref:Beta-galactosidase n=1 Tax=Falsibacillus albus TaxID=2478915 RepID=A0A3L7K2M4_9BACI|nr:beta-galactosidase [Falsibacillus albus]RLQ96624.1 beta-galactosidase [Falsibacillus albus]